MSTLLKCEESIVALGLYSLKRMTEAKRVVADYDVARAIALGDLWVHLRDKNDAIAQDIEQTRQILLNFFRVVEDCYLDHQDFSADALMTAMLEDDPVSHAIVEKYITIAEPLEMAIYRCDGADERKKKNDYISIRERLPFAWLTEKYDVALKSIDPFAPILRVAEEIVRTPKLGDRVVVTKSGSQYGNTATVIDPHWFGRVKVVMDNGVEKSYMFSKGEIEFIDISTAA